jgi:phosphate acetyltransferase/phosphate butyryltransferase
MLCRIGWSDPHYAMVLDTQADYSNQRGSIPKRRGRTKQASGRTDDPASMRHCYLMQTPAYPRPFIITDAAVNIAPSLEEKADIVRNAVDLAHAFGLERARVAILAAVETVNPHMPATLDAAVLCKMADRGQIADPTVDGPLAFDNAVFAAAARTNGIVSEVAGSADILVVPDLESGNMPAKQLQCLGGAASAGAVVGARVPIVFTSRSDSRESRIASCAVALVAAKRIAHSEALSAPASTQSAAASTGVGVLQPAT